MRDWVVLFIVAAIIPLSLYRPFLGLLGFSWLAYMRPQDLSWGLAASLPLSKWVALALYASLVLRGKFNIFRRAPVTFAMLGLWLWLLVGCFTAQHGDIAMAKFSELSKVFLIAFISIVLITDPRRFQISLAVIGLSLGFLGLKYGLYGVLRGGVHITRGVGGMIGDNNDFALALNMALPILLYLGTEMQSRWLRLGSLALVPLTVLTVLFTNSRGGFLSLCAVTLFLILRGRRKFVTLGAVVAVGLLASLFLPSTFYERMGTIVHYQSDNSAMGRLNAWHAAWNMALDYPVFGVGLDNFLFMFRLYAPNPDDVHVAHNTYLQVLAEAGFTGLGLYVALLGAAFCTLWRTGRRARRGGVEWAAGASKFLEASLLAFVVGGTFLNRAHFDLTYHVIILSVCLERIVNQEIAARQAQTREISATERAA